MSQTRIICKCGFPQIHCQCKKTSVNSIISKLIVCLILGLVGCGVETTATFSTVDNEVKEGKKAKVEMIAYEHGPPVYLIEFEGKKYIMSNKGGIVEHKSNSQDKRQDK